MKWITFYSEALRKNPSLKKFSVFIFLRKIIQWTQPRHTNNFILQNYIFHWIRIPQKASPLMLITSTTFFFDAVNNKRQQNKNKTLLYCYTSDSIPNFSCHKQASQTFRDMKLLQREEITCLQSHQANGKAKVVPSITTLLEPQITLGRKRFISTVSCFSTEALPQWFLRGIVISRNALWCLKATDTTTV